MCGFGLDVRREVAECKRSVQPMHGSQQVVWRWAQGACASGAPPQWPTTIVPTLNGERGFWVFGTLTLNRI